jgi:hypothetical protein
MRSQKPSVKAKSFAKYLKSLFIPHVARIPTEMGIEKKDALFMTDNGQSHITHDPMDLPGVASVLIVIFALYTIQIFQTLNSTILAILEQEGKYHLPFENLVVTVTSEDKGDMRESEDSEDPDPLKHMCSISCDWNIGGSKSS